MRASVFLALLVVGCAEARSPSSDGAVTPPEDVPSARDLAAESSMADAPTDRAALDVTADAPTLDAPDAAPLDVVTADIADAVSDLVDAAPADAASLRCPTVFTYRPPSGRAVTRVEVAGEFNGWATPAVAMTADGRGGFAATVPLAPGLVAYKFILDGNWELDPDAARRKYVGGVENSAVLVRDCRAPSITLVRAAATAPTAGAGAYHAEVSITRGVDGAEVDPATVRASLRHDDDVRDVTGVVYDATTRGAVIDVPRLAVGKYTLRVDASDRAGRAAPTLRLVFWVEAQPFTWQGATIYMALVDRFANADRGNDAARAGGVDPRADYQGGDFDGLRARVDDGTLDRLGVRAIWIAPVHRNPAGSYVAADGVHQVTGYHGYWPIRAREVDPRLGGEGSLRALVAAAHARGIRVLQDFVVNHVHREHEYFRAHPEWFRTGCVCGTAGCDWTARRLDCLFADYLPDVNWSLPEVSEQFSADASYWVDRFDMDGLRVDAVKHVEDIAVYNLRARLHDDFEASGERVFLTGETAMGWGDCGLACNAEQYGTITRYIGPRALDGQADFVLYHAAPYRVFSSDERGMLHLDYWTQQSQTQYPAGAVMTPYIGSHDTPRMVTLATYRGQASGLDPSVPGRQWDSVAAAPTSSTRDAYARHRLAMSWLLTIPGAPLLYYGDEYGAWGGADPNNRAMWRDAASLNSDEAATLAWVRLLGTARRELAPLRLGSYVSLAATEETLVFARVHEGRAVWVGLSRAATARTVTVRVPAGVSVADGATLRDRMGGAAVRVTGAMVAVTIPPWGAAVLAE